MVIDFAARHYMNTSCVARLDHGDTLPTKASAYLLHKSDAVYNITAGAKALHLSAAVSVQSRYSVWTR